MTQMLWHQLPIEAGRLARKVEHLIAQLPLEDRTDFDGLVRLQPHSVPRLVLTGQYSSGKSSLISAITDGAAEVVIDSDIATDSVADYDWDGAVTLVDTRVCRRASATTMTWHKRQSARRTCCYLPSA